MSGSRYRLQILDRQTGEIVIGWQPGDMVEVDLVNDLLRRLEGRGVGFLRTEGRVLSTVRQAFGEMLYELKRRV